MKLHKRVSVQQSPRKIPSYFLTLGRLPDVDGGIDMARRYLTSCFVRILVVSDHSVAPPNPQLFTAHEERINCLSFERCNFNVGQDNALEKTLNGCLVGQLFIETSKLPGTFLSTLKVASSMFLQIVIMLRWVF